MTTVKAENLAARKIHQFSVLLDSLELIITYGTFLLQKIIQI